MIEQPNSNGLHIHISKKFFERGGTLSETERDNCYTNFDWVFQKFQKEIEKLGGREYTSYCQSKLDKIKYDIGCSWSVRQYNAKLKTTCEMEKGSGGIPHDDHSSAVNSDNRTIEVRVFKSTTDYKQILAYIEMVRNIAHAVRDTDLKLSLNEILHTKDNLFLDEHIQKVKMKCGKEKQTLDLDTINDNKIIAELFDNERR